ncbi:hypothetical protein [Streptomyces levis]|uniref:hypothetical protein n=1 Tax=Streptomyces levis TaxID=285566 RepID=UPI0031D791B5
MNLSSTHAPDLGSDLTDASGQVSRSTAVDVAPRVTASTLGQFVELLATSTRTTATVALLGTSDPVAKSSGSSTSDVAGTLSTTGTTVSGSGT